MTAGYLLNRLLLQFEDELAFQNLSAVVLVDQHLWVAGDEAKSIERLTRKHANRFGDARSFKLKKLLDEFSNADGEVDVEGLAYDEGYLWLVGSHSIKRKKISDAELKAFTLVDPELKPAPPERNRYLLARIPLVDGELRQAHKQRTAAYLERQNDSNALIDSLKQDPYFAAFFLNRDSDQIALPGKDNGFDVEGLAVCKNRIFIGLRGPVLRGIAVILELAVEDAKPGYLQLKPIGETKTLYRRHFINLNGLGVRELCFQGDDLLILAGPTMVLDGTLRLFRLKNALNLAADSLSTIENQQLEPLFDIPHGIGCDRAEGLTLLPGVGNTDCVLVVYDTPDANRQIDTRSVLADVFTLS